MLYLEYVQLSGVWAQIRINDKTYQFALNRRQNHIASNCVNFVFQPENETLLNPTPLYCNSFQTKFVFICAEKFGALYEFRCFVTAICSITIELGGHCGDKMSALEFVVRFNAYIWLFFQTPCPWINGSKKIYDHENNMATVLFCNNAQMRFIYVLFNRNIQINSIK